MLEGPEVFGPPVFVYLNDYEEYEEWPTLDAYWLRKEKMTMEDINGGTV